MPALTPFGGISLLAHVVINVVAFAYRAITTLFARFSRASQKTAMVRTVRNVTLRPGASFGMRTFAYGIVASMFIFFIGSGMLILSLASHADISGFAANVSSIMKENFVFADVHYVAPSTMTGSSIQAVTSTPAYRSMETDVPITGTPTETGSEDGSFHSSTSTLTFNN